MSGAHQHRHDDHGHAHEHDHAHGHVRDHDHAHGGHHALGHGHAPQDFGRAFSIGVALNLGFVAIEVVYGLLSGSVALLSDAGHNLGDVLGLVAAWAASILVRRAPTARYTYGLLGSSILAALFNSVFLLVAAGAISWEALRRLYEPEPVAGAQVMAVAILGILVNGATAWLFASGRRDDINLRAAFVHMASDALASAAVAAAGLVILLTGWTRIDPLVSLAVNAIIVWGAWGLLKETLAMAMAAAPASVDPERVRAFLLARPGVTAIHDLHIWP
ncbi:MAG TPA: cation diffusion facilitator family transporter, partial [Roseiarcus sp.]|nr:cation diffusion facilitator family transporter [Roseiarcus sp.]